MGTYIQPNYRIFINACWLVQQFHDASQRYYDTLKNGKSDYPMSVRVGGLPEAFDIVDVKKFLTQLGAKYKSLTKITDHICREAEVVYDPFGKRIELEIFPRKLYFDGTLFDFTLGSYLQ